MKKLITTNTKENRELAERCGYKLENIHDNEPFLITHFRNPGEYWCAVPLAAKNVNFMIKNGYTFCDEKCYKFSEEILGEQLQDESKQNDEDAKLLDSFRTEVCHKHDIIDPTDGIDWMSLSIGYFLEKGFDIEKAYGLATIARYRHHYWDYERD